MKKYLIFFLGLFVLLTIGLGWVKISNYSINILSIVAWGVLISESLFFYYTIKYFGQKDHKLEAGFPNILNLLGVVWIDFLAKKYLIETGNEVYVLYDIAIILLTALLNVSVFFKLRKIHGSSLSN